MAKVSVKSKKTVSAKRAAPVAKKERSTVFVAMNIDTDEEITAGSITEMAKLLKTSRTNVSDVCNDSRPNRTTVRGSDGGHWAVA